MLFLSSSAQELVAVSGRKELMSYGWGSQWGKGGYDQWGKGSYGQWGPMPMAGRSIGFLVRHPNLLQVQKPSCSWSLYFLYRAFATSTYKNDGLGCEW